MDLANLMQTLAIEGFTLGRGGCNAIELTGPLPRLTPELRLALAKHKPTLLAMLGPEADAEREAIQQEAEFTWTRRNGKRNRHPLDLAGFGQPASDAGRSSAIGQSEACIDTLLLCKH
jgi:hypothetical protein